MRNKDIKESKLQKTQQRAKGKVNFDAKHQICKKPI
jgi:hypothetical protein